MSSQAERSFLETPALRRGLPYTVLAALALMAGCDGTPATDVLERREIRIAAVEPAQADQGQRLSVRVLGSGFLAGDSVAWELNGQASSLVAVEEAVVVSSSEMQVTITVAAAAQVAAYDVVLTPRKRGIASEQPKGVLPDGFAVREYRPEGLGWIATGMWRGDFSHGGGISSNGTVVGAGGTGSTSNSTAVYWRTGEGPTPFGGSGSYATGISSNGEMIVGVRSPDHPNRLFTMPFVRVDGQVVDLQPLAAPFVSWATAVNDSGTVVGFGARDEWADPTWPVVWRRRADGSYGAPELLPYPGIESWRIDEHDEGSGGYAINNRGHIAGQIVLGYFLAKTTRAVVWRPGATGGYDLIELGGVNGLALAINDDGWVVGAINTVPGAEPRKAVVWSPADYSRPIELPGAFEARGINNARQVVGNSHDRAMIWWLDAAGNVTEIRQLSATQGFTTPQAHAINGNGWVTGLSWRSGPYLQEATLWRP
jgi:uncharacterized membrane protein